MRLSEFLDVCSLGYAGRELCPRPSEEFHLAHQISFWDALILQAAQSAGVAILYTEDLSDGQRYGTVRVVNPFKN